MLSINPAQNTERENYKLLTGTIIPRPIAFVTTVSEQGILNGAPFSYFNIVSSNPPMVSVSIQRSNGAQKDTARNILAKQQFVVHLVDMENVTKVNETAANLPADQSEIAFAGLTPIESENIAVPGVLEAKVRMECQLVQSLELGDSNTPGCDFFIGEVVQFHIDPVIYQAGKIDAATFGAVSRLAGSDYATLGKTFSIERPK